MGEAQLNTSMHVLGEAMTMAKLASASRVPWLRRTTSKQLHTHAAQPQHNSTQAKQLLVGLCPLCRATPRSATP